MDGDIGDIIKCSLNVQIKKTHLANDKNSWFQNVYFKLKFYIKFKES